MKRLSVLAYKGINRIMGLFSYYFNQLICNILFYSNGISYENFHSNGIPFVSVALGGKCVFGNELSLNNTIASNPIGRPQKCIFFVDNGAKLVIGKQVGLSQVAISCHLSITIGNYVKIGGGTCIYDTDFHSLNADFRRDIKLDFADKQKSPVVIGDNVFIGAHSTILKGVSIGENSIVGACSVVTKNVPANEIWAGNPAKMIKKIIDSR